MSERGDEIRKGFAREVEEGSRPSVWHLTGVPNHRTAKEAPMQLDPVLVHLEVNKWRLRAVRAEQEVATLQAALQEALGGATVSYLRDELELAHAQIESLQAQLTLCWATQ